MVSQAPRESDAAGVNDAVDELRAWWPLGDHCNPYLADPRVDPMALSLADIEEAMLALRAELAQYRGVNEDGDKVYFRWTPEQRREIAALRERLLAVSLAWLAALGHWDGHGPVNKSALPAASSRGAGAIASPPRSSGHAPG